jgi:hypothetical protein
MKMNTAVRDIYLNLLNDPENNKYKVLSIEKDGSVIMEHWSAQYNGVVWYATRFRLRHGEEHSKLVDGITELRYE